MTTSYFYFRNVHTLWCISERVQVMGGICPQPGPGGILGFRHEWATVRLKPTPLLPGEASVWRCAVSSWDGRLLRLTPDRAKHQRSVWGIPRPYLEGCMRIRLLQRVFLHEGYIHSPQDSAASQITDNDFPKLSTFYEMKQQNKSRWRKCISVMTLAFSWLKRTTFPFINFCLFYSYFFKVSIWGESIFLTYNFVLFLFCLLFCCCLS